MVYTPCPVWVNLCLHDEIGKTLVVGDMVASVGTILIAPGDGDMRIYLEQLERLARLDARVALPAHGEPIEAPSAFFRRYIQHRLMREEKVRAAVDAAGAGGATPEDLVPKVYDDTPAHVWPIALLSLRAHLAKLEAEGRVRRHARRYASA